MAAFTLYEYKSVSRRAELPHLQVPTVIGPYSTFFNNGRRQLLVLKQQFNYRVELECQRMHSVTLLT
jgi:hypothetical protein